MSVGMGTIPIPSIDAVDTCEVEVSIDTSTKYMKTQENDCQSKRRKMRFFFLEICLIELAQGKIINCVPDRILHSRLKPILQRY